MSAEIVEKLDQKSGTALLAARCGLDRSHMMCVMAVHSRSLAGAGLAMLTRRGGRGPVSGCPVLPARPAARLIWGIHPLFDPGVSDQSCRSLRLPRTVPRNSQLSVLGNAQLVGTPCTWKKTFESLPAICAPRGIKPARCPAISCVRDEETLLRDDNSDQTGPVASHRREAARKAVTRPAKSATLKPRRTTNGPGTGLKNKAVGGGRRELRTLQCADLRSRCATKA